MTIPTSWAPDKLTSLVAPADGLSGCRPQATNFGVGGAKNLSGVANECNNA